MYKELESLFRTIKHNLMLKLILLCHPKIEEILKKNNIHGPLIGKITKTENYYFKENNLRYLNGYEDKDNMEIRFDELRLKDSNEILEYYILNHDIKTNSKDKQLILNNLEKIISGYLLRYKDNLFYNRNTATKNEIIGYKNCNYLYEIEKKTVDFEKAFIYKKFDKEEKQFKDFSIEDMRMIKESYKKKKNI